MIKNLSISNFKSIKQLDLPCKKLNVFIGEPNSGKSNIIEALTLQSQNAISHQMINPGMFRYKTIGDLFYDFNINTPIEVATNERKTKLSYSIRENKAPDHVFDYTLDETIKEPTKFTHNGKVQIQGDLGKTNVHFYEYKRLSSFNLTYFPHLEVPFGVNLPSLLLANSELKKWVSEFFQSKGLTLTLKPTENDITVSKFVNGEIYSYPYFSISETLQRVVFYAIAIMSNKESVLLFDEPESNTFPFYTKFLGEKIALDETNQFFITTHNPYLLLNLIEKSKFSDLNVCIVEMKDYQTKAISLNENQVSKVLDFNSDVFFNFDQIISE
jgi:AAA15 family ATPase/GTPase